MIVYSLTIVVKQVYTRLDGTSSTKRRPARTTEGSHPQLPLLTIEEESASQDRAQPDTAAIEAGQAGEPTGESQFWLAVRGHRQCCRRTRESLPQLKR